MHWDDTHLAARRQPPAKAQGDLHLQVLPNHRGFGFNAMRAPIAVLRRLKRPNLSLAVSDGRRILLNRLVIRICGGYEPESRRLLPGHIARKRDQPNPSRSEAPLRRRPKTPHPAHVRVLARAARRPARRPYPRSADGAEPDPAAQPRDALWISSREPARSNQRRSTSIRRSRWRGQPATSEGHSRDGRPLSRSGRACGQGRRPDPRLGNVHLSLLAFGRNQTAAMTPLAQ